MRILEWEYNYAIMRKRFRAPDPNSLNHHRDKITPKRTVWHTRFDEKFILYHTLLRFTKKWLHTTFPQVYSINRPTRFSYGWRHNFLRKSLHQTSTKDPLIYPQTLTSNASTSSSHNTRKPNQNLNLIYILKILCHLLPNQHLMPQRALPIASSKSCIKYNVINKQHN